MAEDLPSKSGHGSKRGTIVLLLAIIGAFAVLTVEELRRFRQQNPAPFTDSPDGNPSSPGAGPERITDYVGAAACRECHPSESALYARSGHRRTLWPAQVGRSPVVAWLDGKTRKDPEVPEVTWSYQVRDGHLVAGRNVDGRSETVSLDYGFGSGKNGVTFVALRPGANPGLDPQGLEHRLSFFADGPRIGITPGQERPAKNRLAPHEVPMGNPMPPNRIQQCFGCHSTLTSTLGSNRLEPATLVPNVSCERCHGPGRSHVEAARRGEDQLAMRMGFDRVEPYVELRLCGECHRLPHAISGGKLKHDNLEIVRYQGVGISLSSCYARGQSGLRCVSCHEPHDRVSTDRVAYAAVCLSCHGTESKSQQKACPVSPASRCIDCHMPRRGASGNVRFTDHWIRRPDSTVIPGGNRPSAVEASAVQPRPHARAVP